MNKQVRDHLPDVLRGLALLGIIMVNAPYVALDSASGYFSGGWQDPFDGLVTFIVAAIFEGKFYLLFAFLYGYSATYIVRSPDLPLTRWRRRSLVLLAFGFAHAVLLFHGDILFLYGLVGLAVAGALKLQTANLGKLIRRTALAVSGYYLALLVLVYLATFIPEAAPTGPDALTLALTQGTYIDAVAVRFFTWIETISAVVFLQGPLVVVAALVGIASGRVRLLSQDWSPIWTKVTVIGLALGFPVQIVLSYFTVYGTHIGFSVEFAFVFTLLAMMTAPLMSAGLVGLVKLAVARGFKVGENIGRMSLTGYLSESLLMGVAFSAWGLGLSGASAWVVVLVGVVIWFSLEQFSRFWMSGHSKGPVEALVGVITTGKAVSK